MYLVAAFEGSLSLELAISDLIQNGFDKEHILVVPLQQKADFRDGNSIVDSAAVAGTALMVLGVIYGFVLHWGPVIWGLIGLLAGAATGALLAFARSRAWHAGIKPKEIPKKVVLIINCTGNKVQEPEQILWNNQALGVGRLER